MLPDFQLLQKTYAVSLQLQKNYMFKNSKYQT